VVAEVAVLGPVMAVTDGGEPVALRSQVQRLLLALLASRHGRVVTADALVEALWGDGLPVQPYAALQSQIFRLRRRLGPMSAWVETDGPGYRLACARTGLDATRFEDLLGAARAQQADPMAALAALDRALALWRGPAYLEVAEHDAVRPEAMRIEELRTEASEERAEILIALGRTADATREMEALCRLHPFRERPVNLRMRALAAGGRHADALRVMAQFRRQLGDDLGLEPSPELGALEGEILRHETPPHRTVGLPGNSFVGRDEDLQAVLSKLADARLVTLVGPGGVGKTRLALHVASRVADRYPDGVWVCELAKVTGPDAVDGAVASLLRVEGGSNWGAGERVVEYLRTKRLLLVLDNCEHVAGAVNTLVSAVLAHAADVDVLATSRRRLGVDGEHLIPVDPLPTAPAGSAGGPAVTLFADRAAAVRPGFALGAGNIAAVAELCRRLDGLPLAIELAAARSVARGPSEILAEVTERLDGLHDRRRSVERHRSINDVVEWSYRLLNGYEQAVFCQLAVFTGGCTAESAAAVVIGDGVVADALTALVEHSLLQAREVAGCTRYTMLEPVREYAESRLNEEGVLDDTRARHGAWAARWVRMADEGVRGPDEMRWAIAIETELANLRAAHRWSLGTGDDAAVHITGALFWFASWYGPAEVFSWADQVVERFGESGHPGLAGACATAALGAWRRGQPGRARVLAQRAIDIAPPDRPTLARFAWEALASTELLAANYQQALACLDRSIELAQEVGDRCHEARERAARALALGYQGLPAAAEAELEVVNTLLATQENPTVRAFADYVAGEISLDRAPRKALPALRRAHGSAQRIGNRYLSAIAGVSSVSCAARLGDPGEGLAEFSELIDHFHRTGSWAQQWTTMRMLIETLVRVGADEPAAVLYGALAASETAPPIVGADVARMAEAVRAMRSRLGAGRFAALEAEGAGMGGDGVIAYALRHARSTGGEPSRSP
jgi:predicted ATPase/DNA-binding SARP family transcriptional activator